MSSRRRHVGNRDNPNANRCLGVFGLSIGTTEQELYHIFSKYGPVERVVVVIDAKVILNLTFRLLYNIQFNHFHYPRKIILAFLMH